jgi:predicted RNA-binding protein with PIN domain
MPLIIDGHNLVGKLSTIDLADPDDEEQLIRLLVRYLLQEGKRGIVFFDRGAPGAMKELAFGRLTVRFSSPPQTADDAILNYLRQISPQAQNYTVVSSDGQLLSAARRVGARSMPSEEFAILLLNKELDGPISEKPDQTLSPEDIDDWEQLFSSSNSDK